PADHGQDGFDVSMGECVQGWEHFGGGYEGLPLERAADQVDHGEWQIGEVSQGFMLDLAILSKGATEIIAGVGDTLDGGGDFVNVNCAWFADHARNTSEKAGQSQGQRKKILATNCTEFTEKSFSDNKLCQKPAWNSGLETLY